MLGAPNRNANASQWIHQPKLVTQQNHLAGDVREVGGSVAIGGMDGWGEQDAREMVNKISMTVPVYHWRMWWSRKKSHRIKDNIQNGERLFSHSQTVMAIAAFCSRTTGNMTCKLNKTSCDSLNDLTTNNTFNHSNSVKFTVIKHELQSDDLWLTIITHVIRFSQLFSWDSHHFYAQKDIHGLRRQQGSDVGDHVVQIVLGNGLQRNGWMGPWIAWICRWLYKPC